MEPMSHPSSEPPPIPVSGQPSPVAGPVSPPPPIAPAPPATQQEWAGLLPLLVVMALAFGLLASWALHAHRGRSQMLSRLQGVAKDAAITEARADQLGRFLLDARTRLVHLRGTAGATGRAATIAWNPDRAEGVVLVEGDTPRRLRLLVQRDRQPPVQLLQFHSSSPGGHAFRFPGPLQPGTMTFMIESVAAPDSTVAERYEQAGL